MPLVLRLFAHVRTLAAREVMLAEDRPDVLRDYLRDHHELLDAEQVPLFVLPPASEMRADLGDATQPLTLLLDANLVVRQAFIGPLAERRSELLSAIDRLARCPGHF